MEKEVGMYVRTKNGCICQILRTTYSKYLSRNKEVCYEVDRPINVNMELYEEDILKASDKIIELIEEKDLVEIEYYSLRKNERVTRLFEVSKYNQYLTFSNAKCEFLLSCGEFTKEDKELKPVIKSILTREQFESCVYKVGE